MKLLRDYLKNCIKRANKNNMKVRVIGDVSGLSQDLQDKIRQLEEASKDNTGINFTIALNYGSRDEMVSAMKYPVRPNSERGHHGSIIPELSGYQRSSGSGSDDPDQRRRASVQFHALAAGLHRILFYRCAVAGL